MEAQKIFAVPLSDGSHAIIAKSGIMESADYFQETFENLVAKGPIVSSRSVADMAEEAMKHTHLRYLDGLRKERASLEELDRQIATYNCEILVGYLHNKESYLYSVGLASYNAIRIRAPFYVTGSGANLARAVLSGFNLGSMSEIEGMPVACYAIENAKKFDEYCSGPLQLAAVHLTRIPESKPTYTLLNRNGADFQARMCEEVYGQMKISLPKLLREKMEAVARANAQNGAPPLDRSKTDAQPSLNAEEKTNP